MMPTSPSRSFQHSTPSAVTPPAERSDHQPERTAVRRAFDIVGNGFLAAFIAQVLLAGWSLFNEPQRWDWHRTLGHTLEIVALVLVILGFVGRLPRPQRHATILLLVLTTVQGALAGIGGVPGAFHPVNALAIGLIAFRLALRR